VVLLATFGALLGVAHVVHQRRIDDDDPPKASVAPQRGIDAAPRFDASSYRIEASVPAIAYAAVWPQGSLEGATGIADVERRVSATSTTIFHAASIAKLVVATCVLALEAEHRVDLDVDVAHYLDFSLRRTVTLRMLLAHTSSIRDDDETFAPRGASLGDFLRRYLARDSAWEDRAAGQYLYSNAGASLAAYVVERVSGESFDEHSKRTVFDPLAMTSTSWAAAGSNGAVPYADHALPHASHALYPSDDLYTTAHDLARFATMLAKRGSPGQPGFQTHTLGAHAALGHEGEDRGVSTALFVAPAEGIGAVVLTNGDAFGSGDARRAAAIESLLIALLDEASSNKRTAIGSPP
jgi:CubicO group peptidase (beta-lactamase class C family)